jgi:hypothetical protein
MKCSYPSDGRHDFGLLGKYCNLRSHHGNFASPKLQKLCIKYLINAHQVAPRFQNCTTNWKTMQRHMVVTLSAQLKAIISSSFAPASA